MQLVLSNNRIIAHGENFLAMGGVVINTETGAKYENATIAECNSGCPSDIDEVGYEYHAGVFVPCAPFGKGNNNGYFMEVCETCATPRNSGILVRDLKWDKIASINCVVEETRDSLDRTYTFPIDADTLWEYSMFRYKIKAGSFIQVGEYVTGRYTTSHETLLTFGSSTLLEHYITDQKPDGTYISASERIYTKNKRISFEKDYIIISSTKPSMNFEINDDSDIPIYKVTNGSNFLHTAEIILPKCINYGTHCNKANIVFEIEGRK